MSLSSKIQNLAVRVASQFKIVMASIDTVTDTANSTKTTVDNLSGDAFVGKIEMYYGSLDSTKKHPVVGNTTYRNWQVCDGTNGTPDLRDRFVIGASSTRALGTTNSASGSITVDKESFEYSMSTKSLGSTTLTVQTGVSPYVALYYVMKIA